MAAYWFGCSDFQICQVLLLCREQKKYCHDVKFGSFVQMLIDRSQSSHSHFLSECENDFGTLIFPPAPIANSEFNVQGVLVQVV